MPIKGYGVLKGKAIDTIEGQGLNPHFQVKIIDDDLFRIAIDVKSQEEPSTVLYYLDEDFNHPILKDLRTLSSGFQGLESKPGGLALDYIRGNLFDTTQMKPLPYNLPSHNDLNDLLQKYVDKAISMENSEIYAFGQRWGPENDKRDQYFGFIPGNGIHDIHMNQGNRDKWVDDDGTWQDGGILFHYPDENKWVAIFLAFQSQCFHTDDTTGHLILDACEAETFAAAVTIAKRVIIIAALLNPVGSGERSVTIFNATPGSISLNGWKLADRNKMKIDLSGTLNAGEILKIQITRDDFELSKDGGIITLLDNKGLKVDGVSYTADDASKEGWTTVF